MSVELTFGQWLKQRRRQLDLTQDELAQQIGCSVATIRKIEQDARRPSKQLAELMATELQIPLAQQVSFITFARTETYMAPMPEELTIFEHAAAELPPLPGTVTAVYGTPPTLPHHNLPLQATPFIGREQELTRLHQLIAEPQTRLITIVGAGGMGKTRLALAAAEHMLKSEKFANGVFFVNLSPLSEAQHIATALADALGYQLIGRDGRSPQQQLFDYLHQKEILLLFDNFEHLLAGADLLNDILQAAPKVKILVTSRERLHLRSEQVYPIEGLEFPDWETVSLMGEKGDVELYTAVQLFLQSARRNQPNFALHNEDDIHLSHICRTVAGMPLALELAASWVDVLSLADMAVELQQGLDLLETDMQDMPERHRSIRAAINYSWQKLDKKEQDIFAGLSVFRGGFTREAARAVVGANLRQLAQLVNKSWLQAGGVRGDGRYQVHELLRQYGAEKLAEDMERETAVREAHCAYYCELLNQWEFNQRIPRIEVTVAEVALESGNVQIAWSWVIEQKNVAQLNQVLDSLCQFYSSQNLFEEGESLCQLTADKLAQLPISGFTNEAITYLQAKLLIRQAEFNMMLYRREVAGELLQQSQAILDSPNLANQDTRTERVRLMHAMGNVARGDWEVTRALYEQSLALNKELKKPFNIVLSLNQLAQATAKCGDYEKAIELGKESLTLSQELDRPYLSAVMLNFLGDWVKIMGRFDEAEQHYEKSLTISQANGLNGLMGETLWAFGCLALFQGSFETSHDYLQQSLTLCRQVENPYVLFHVLTDLGLALGLTGYFDQARPFIEESRSLAQEMGDLHRVAWSTSVQGEMDAWTGRYKEARVKAQKALALGQQPMVSINPKMTRYRTAHPKRVLGWVALAEKAYSEAYRLLAESVEGYREDAIDHEYIAISLAALGRAAYGLGQGKEAQQYLIEAMNIVIKMKAFVPLLHLMPLISVLLADDEVMRRKEYAVAIYSLAKSHPFVAKAHLFQDIAGQQIAAVTASLPPETIAAAQSQGRTLDWWQTAESLLTKLTELGWGDD